MPSTVKCCQQPRNPNCEHFVHTYNASLKCEERHKVAGNSGGIDLDETGEDDDTMKDRPLEYMEEILQCGFCQERQSQRGQESR